MENPKNLENIFEDKRLYNIISNLNYKNKKLLFLLYVKELNEVEVANELGISKQAFYKRKNNILKKIKEQYLKQ